MAVVKYTGLIDQLRGRLNGTVFSKFHSGFNSYKKGQPKSWGSEAQLRRRQMIQDIAQTWHSLTQTQRNTWATVAAATPVVNRLGDEVYLPTYQYFVKYSAWYLLQGQTYRLDVFTDLVKPASAFMLSADLTVTQQGGNYQISGLSGILQILTGSTANTDFMVYLSSPFSWAPLSYQGTYWFVGTVTTGGATITDQQIAMDFTDITMPEGWSSFTGATHELMIRPVQRARAQTSPVIKFKLPVDFIPPAPPVFTPVITVYDQFSASADASDTAPGRWVFNQARFALQVSESLSPPASNYAIEVQMSATVQPGSTPIPSNITGSEYLYQGDIISIFNTGNNRFTAIAPAAMVSLLNTEWPWSNANYQEYKTFRIRMLEKSSGLWSEWQYLPYRLNFL